MNLIIQIWIINLILNLTLFKLHWINTKKYWEGILYKYLNRVPWKTFYLLRVEWGGGSCKIRYNNKNIYLTTLLLCKQQYKRKGKNPFICLSIFRFWPNAKIAKIVKNRFNIYLIKFLFIFLFFIFFIFIFFSFFSSFLFYFLYIYHSYLIRYFLYCYNSKSVIYITIYSNRSAQHSTSMWKYILLFFWDSALTSTWIYSPWGREAHISLLHLEWHLSVSHLQHLEMLAEQYVSQWFG